MANIQSNLNKIKNAVLGVEVRDSIHDGIKAMNEEVEKTTGKQEQLEGVFDELIINAGSSNAGSSNAEVVAARVDATGKSHGTLGKRLNNFDSQIKDIENNTDFLGTTYSNFDNFVELENYIINNVVNNGGNKHDRGKVVVEIPPGEYTIKDVNILSKYARRTGGLTFKGAGSKITIINFEPIENDQYLFLNNDTWLNLRFEDIQFKGNIDKNTSFMRSVGNGGAQNYIFKDCFFVNWNNILDLKGTDCNSEMTFYSCNFNGVINNVIYVGEDVSTEGDQFLNYNFFGCNYEVSKGNFINMFRGGNINVYGGSFIHTQFDSEECEGGTFFNLPYHTHAYGVCRLLVMGARFEFRNRNSKLIDCKWTSGNIEFLNCDGECYELNKDSKNWINAVFDCSLGSSPSVVFDNCSLLGKHKYICGTEGYMNIKNIIYQNCKLSQTPHDFIVFDKSNSNAGALPHIKFKNNKSFADCDLNSLVAGRAVLTKKYLSVKNWFGSLPFSNDSQEVKLPLNCIITGFRLYLPAGAMSSAKSVKLKLETSETSPTVLFNTADEGEILYYQGFNYNKEMFYVCDTIEKTTLKFTDFNNLDQTSTKSICLIEYI